MDEQSNDQVKEKNCKKANWFLLYLWQLQINISTIPIIIRKNVCCFIAYLCNFSNSIAVFNHTKFLHCCQVAYFFKLRNNFSVLLILSFLFTDAPTQMPPLTPGTNKKLTEVLNASFASWEKEVQSCKITKGGFSN